MKTILLFPIYWFMLIFVNPLNAQVIYGCLDPNAMNYDSLANTDDGSCICDINSKNIKLGIPSSTDNLTPYVNLSILTLDSVVLIPIDTTYVYPDPYQVRLIVNYGCQSDCFKLEREFNENYFEEIGLTDPDDGEFYDNYGTSSFVRFRARLFFDDTDTIFAPVQTYLFSLPFYSGVDSSLSCFGCTDSTSENFSENALYDDGSCICQQGNAVLISEGDYLSYAIVNGLDYNFNEFGLFKNDSTLINYKNNYLLKNKNIYNYGCVAECAMFQLSYLTNNSLVADGDYPGFDYYTNYNQLEYYDLQMGDYKNLVELMVNGELIKLNPFGGYEYYVGGFEFYDYFYPQLDGTIDSGPDPDGIYSFLIQNTDSIDFTSCQFSVGCVDTSATNYDNTVTFANNVSCYYYPGCNLEFAENFDPIVDYNNGSCQVVGCLDTLALNNYDFITIDDGYCTYGLGCTDSLADNYNPYAIGDNNICFYYPDSLANVQIGARAFGNPMFGWNLISNEDSTLFFDITPLTYTNESNTQFYKISLPLGCYTLNFRDYNRFDYLFASYYYQVKVGEETVIPGQYHGSGFDNDYKFSVSFCVNTLETTITNFLESKFLYIYPNPSKDGIFFIETDVDFNLYSVTDQLGNILESGNLIADIWNFSLSKYDAGIYYLKLTNKTNTVVKKVIKM